MPDFCGPAVAAPLLTALLVPGAAELRAGSWMEFGMLPLVEDGDLATSALP